MEKTTLQLLIEERAGKDLKEVLSLAVEQGGSIAGACQFMREQYRAAPSPQVLQQWIDAMGGTLGKTLRWDGATADRAEEAQVLA